METRGAHSLSRVVFLIAAVDALVITAVFVIEIVLAAASATGATGRMMGRRKLRRDHRRKRRRGRYPTVRRQSRDRRVAQEGVRLVHVLPIHHIPFEIVYGIHDDGIRCPVSGSSIITHKFDDRGSHGR